MLVANVVHFAQPGGDCLVVFAQLGQHVRRLDIVGFVVEDTPGARDVADRTQRGAAELADALGDRVGLRAELVGLRVEHAVVCAQVRPAHAPVETFRLYVEREHVGQHAVHRGGSVLRGGRLEVDRHQPRRSWAGLRNARVDRRFAGLVPGFFIVVPFRCTHRADDDRAHGQSRLSGQGRGILGRTMLHCRLIGSGHLNSSRKVTPALDLASSVAMGCSQGGTCRSGLPARGAIRCRRQPSFAYDTSGSTDPGAMTPSACTPTLSSHSIFFVQRESLRAAVKAPDDAWNAAPPCRRSVRHRSPSRSRRVPPCTCTCGYTASWRRSAMRSGS